MPVTGELTGDIGDRPACADLNGRPFGAPRRQQAVLRGDAMIGTGPTGPGAIGLPADQTVFTPRQPHRLAVDGQVDIAHRRALLDLAGPTAARAGPLDDGLLDNQLDIAADAPIGAAHGCL